MSTDAAVVWLRSCITARLDLAKSASGDGGSTWHTDSEGCCVRNEGGDYITQKGDIWGDFLARHIAANDPQDTIARCEAELAILDEHHQGPNGSVWCCVCDPAADMNDSDRWYPCNTARSVAGAYRHKPGYADHWGQQ